MGKWTTEEEINKVLEVLPGIISKLRAMSPLMKTAN
jgi:cysteine sulfinate desulfinase/cysteine desulfurase-like protein